MAWVCGQTVRILTHERARAAGGLMMDAIMGIVRRDGLAGVTMTRALEGWSAHGGVRTSGWADLSDDLPVLIEIVDRVEKIEAALPDIIALGAHGVLSVSDTQLYVAE